MHLIRHLSMIATSVVLVLLVGCANKHPDLACREGIQKMEPRYIEELGLVRTDRSMNWHSRQAAAQSQFRYAKMLERRGQYSTCLKVLKAVRVAYDRNTRAEFPRSRAFQLDPLPTPQKRPHVGGIESAPRDQGGNAPVQ